MGSHKADTEYKDEVDPTVKDLEAASRGAILDRLLESRFVALVKPVVDNHSSEVDNHSSAVRMMCQIISLRSQDMDPAQHEEAFLEKGDLQEVGVLGEVDTRRCLPEAVTMVGCLPEEVNIVEFLRQADFSGEVRVNVFQTIELKKSTRVSTHLVNDEGPGYAVPRNHHVSDVLGGR